ncbi:MAG: response regulator [Planctomycetes bacterium]|nr:response regulator [Planctomycetota bacterium]
MARLLVVDDNENQRLLYQEELTEEGHKVTLAKDGWEAVKLAKDETPDLVILDISMPGMDGIEALGRMLADNNKLPVIIHTAYATYKDNFMTWSADAYVVKSSDLAELKAKVRELLEGVAKVS